MARSKQTDLQGRVREQAKPRLLIVDDNPELVDFLVEFFNFKGFDCTMASDGQQALDLLKASDFDLLITDINMPVMNGLDLIRNVNEFRPTLPKIILSGEGRFDDALLALNANVESYFTKPIRDFNEFEQAVRTALTKAEKEKEKTQLQTKVTGLQKKLTHIEKIRTKEVRRRDKHYRTLLENGNDAIIILDAVGNVADINQNSCRLFGLSRGELLGRCISDEVHNAELRLFFHQIHEATQQSQEFRCESELPRPDGSRRQVEVVALAVMGATSPEHIVYIRDVSEYHRRMQTLKTRNEQLLNALSDRKDNVRLNAGTLNNFLMTANAFVFIMDRDGGVIEWNPAAERISGISRSDALSGKILNQLFVKFHNQIRPLIDHEVFEAGRDLESVEAEITAAGNTSRIYSWNISPLHDSGKIVGALAVGVDVTADHQLRRELEHYATQLEQTVSERTRDLLQSQERFRNLFEGVRDAIFAAGPDGRLLEINPAYLTLLGYSTRNELVGKHFLHDFAVESKEADFLLELLATRQYVQDHLIQLRRRDGSIVSTLVTITAQRAITPESSAFEGVIRDITRLRQLEQKLVEHSHSLEDLVRSRSVELAESEAKFRRLTENSPDIIYRIDIQKMKFDHLSPAVEAITGFSIEKLRQMGPDGFVSRIHPKEAPQVLELWVRLSAGETGDREAFHQFYRFIKADGNIIWLADHGIVIRSDSGAIVAVEGVMRDITVEKNASQHIEEHANVLELEVERRTAALAESEYRYRMLLGEAGDIIFMCDYEGKVQEINRRGEDLLGRTLSDLSGVGFGSLLDESSRRRFNKALMSCYKAGIKPEPFQIDYSNPRGSKLLLEIQSSPLIIDDRVVLVLQVARDLTSRRRAAQAIRTLKEFNEGIIRSMSEGIFIENDEGICEFVNPAMAEMLGYKPSEMEGHYYHEFVPPVDRDFVGSNTEIRRMRGFSRYEARLVSINGEEIPVHISSRSRFEGDRVIGALSVVTDLRQTKEMERRQRFMERLLADERKLADIGMLAAGIAHNISSPLMVISGYAQLLKTKLPKVKEFDVILSQIDKISEITRNMMIKSRSEQDKAVKPIDLNELLRTELKFLEANLQFKSKIEKQYHYDPELPKLNGVYSDFSQAFSNIINNALDAMYSRSIRKLTVTTRHTSTENIVEISDTGGGIPPENLERIFDPFFTTKPPVGAVKEGEPTGTGLGLSTSQQLIGNYHGRIEVTSDYGIGTTFKIILPIDIPSAIEAPLPTPVDSNSGELLEVAK